MLGLDELSGQSTLLDKTVYGVENSSTFLECSPKSQRALTYWQYQRSTEDRKQEVGTILSDSILSKQTRALFAELLNSDKWYLTSRLF